MHIIPDGALAWRKVFKYVECLIMMILCCVQVAQVKCVLHTSYVPEEEEPLGRFEQIEVLQECINSSISSRSGACIYVSGLPGTGKLLLMHQQVQYL